MTKDIYPCLWFDGKAQEAAAFYCSVFPNSKIVSDNQMTVHWEINGKLFMGLNGGPMYKMTEGISFVIHCEDQKEIDYYWDHFTSNGGEESMCGWCKDKFGVSWQVIPHNLGELMGHPEKGQKVIAAFMQMKKFDIATLMNV